ncbi:MAG: hypothetical protein IPK39_23110 [Sulfuritalea sp.]|nr:hypothetical protein [Sulfuritalea sp.]
MRQIQRKATRMGSDPDGGYIVPVEMDQMIDRIVPTISAMSRLAKMSSPSTHRRVRKLVKTSAWLCTGLPKAAPAEKARTRNMPRSPLKCSKPRSNPGYTTPRLTMPLIDRRHRPGG